MTSRERVRKSLNFTEPDRIPVDWGGGVTGIHEVAYRNLLKYLGKEEEIEITREQLLDKMKKDNLVCTINGCFFLPSNNSL